MKIRLYPYRMYSGSAKSLAEALGALRVKPDSTRYRPNASHTIINWGNSQLPTWPTNIGHWLNTPTSVAAASNKLSALTIMKENEINVPPFTTDPEQARNWSDGGYVVFARQTLNGHSGSGIGEIEPGNPITPAPLYTQYLSKRHEYRIHVVGATVIDIQQKRRKLSVPDSEVNWRIRTNSNGFVFCRANVRPPPAAQEVAVQAVKSLDLDFGAVDVIVHERRPVVLEVNTAPGLFPSTVAKYSAAFLSLIAERDQS